nr:retrovirus-related Pol polyprotein from transposon TNT 1-94 [Tanacetum cinerariifolium]
RVVKGLIERIASVRNFRRIQVRYIAKDVDDHLKAYSLGGMDISCKAEWRDKVSFILNTDLSTKVDTIPNENNNNTCTKNVILNVVVEDLPQLLDSRGGSHVTNVPEFDIEDFSSWKDSGHLRTEGSKIKCITAKAMWNDLILAHKGPFDIGDTKIGTLRLKFNAFKALRVKYKSLKCELAILTKKIDAMSKNKSDKGLVAELFDWDEESLSSEDEGVTRVKAFTAIAEDEPTVGKADDRSSQWVEITMKKKVVVKWTSNKVTLDQLLTEQVPSNIVRDLRGRGKRKETISPKEVLFSKADESPSKTAPEITSDSKSECDNQEPLPHLPKLLGVVPIGILADIISIADLTYTLIVSDKTKKKADSSTEQLLLTLMEEVNGLKEQIKPSPDNSTSVSQIRSSKSSKGKQKAWFGPCKHYGFRNYLLEDCYDKPECSTCQSTDHLTKEHPEQDYLNRSVWHLDSGSSRHMTRVKQYLHIYSKEPGPKVVFRDNSLGDTEGYGFVNYNGITFTRVAYVNGLKHNLISISELYDANFKVLFTKTQGTIFNQRNEVMLVSPIRRDVYVIDMSSYNKESNACFFAKASNSVNWLCKDDEEISQTNTEGYEINFNEKSSFIDDEFLVPRSKTPQCSRNDYFPYVPAFDPFSTNNITIPDPIALTVQDINSPDESPKYSIANDHHIYHEPDDFDPAKAHNDSSDS